MPRPEELIGRTVGRYTIVRHLASGGMAELYIARQESVGGFEKDLVVKMLRPAYAENPRVVAMFLDEARLAARLNHPNIVHVYDVGDADGVKYIAMEYIHGETITDIIRRGIAVDRYLPLEHAVQVISQTAAGLAYAHGRPGPDGRRLCIVHRDVSPSNILVTYEGQTKIVDFGIARAQDQIREESGMRPGKVSYMSPEQVRGEPADPRSDIFSLGILLYETTLGRRLWRGPPDVVLKRIVEERVPPPTYINREYPPALELIVMHALEKNPADRYQSAEEMRHDLEEFLDDAGLRSGNRRIAAYVNELFAPEIEPSEAGVTRARQYNEPSDGIATAADDSEELNFDRRAPLAIRFQPASSPFPPLGALPPPIGGPTPARDAPGAVLRNAGGRAEPRSHRPPPLPRAALAASAPPTLTPDRPAPPPPVPEAQDRGPSPREVTETGPKASQEPPARAAERGPAGRGPWTWVAVATVVAAVAAMALAVLR